MSIHSQPPSNRHTEMGDVSPVVVIADQIVDYFENVVGLTRDQITRTLLRDILSIESVNYVVRIPTSADQPDTTSGDANGSAL